MVDMKKLKNLTKELSILYVEDDYDIRVQMENIFNKFFKKVIIAENGKEGLDTFNKNRLDIVITDIRMPIMDGLDMISEIKSLDQNIPIIITTAFNDTDYLMKAIELGIDKYIVKPVDRTLTLNTLYFVSKLINDRKKAKEYEQKLTQERINETTTDTLKEITNAYPNPSVLFNLDEVKFINSAFRDMFEATLLKKICDKEISLNELFIKKDSFLNNLNDIDEDLSKNRVLIETKGEEKIYRVILKEIELNSIKHKLFTFNDITLIEKQKDKIKELNQLSIALSLESDLNKLLERILSDAREFTLADGGTIYLKDRSKLSFIVVQNDTLNIHLNKREDINWTPIELFDEYGRENIGILSANSVLHKKVINIKDVYKNEEFDLRGVKNFDKSTNYHTKSILTVPMKDPKGESIGVLQLINKIENSKLGSFNLDDKEVANSLASLATIAILRINQERLLIKQSKMAAVGEMIDSIAHQWKQPLSILSLYAIEIPFKFEVNEMDLEYSNDVSKKILSQIHHMTNTLDEFRSFFRPNKEKIEFKIVDVINSTLLLVKDDFIKSKIQVNVDIDENIKNCGYPNEYKHVILNIINNARDAFKERNINHLNREIIFKLEKNEHIILYIIDNAGGIKDEILPHIFDANFTTKDEGKGSGVGLYMSQTIIHNMSGEIEAKNILNDKNEKIGVEFKVSIPKMECK